MRSDELLEEALMELVEVVKHRFNEIDRRLDEIEHRLNMMEQEPRRSLVRQLRQKGIRL